MKRLVLVLLGLMVFSGIAYAQHIGPGVPAKNQQGNIATPNLGIGYSYYQAEYDDDVDLEGNRIYAHIGAVFGDVSTPSYEIYARIGATDVEDGDDFESDFEPMYAAGIKGQFYQGQTFGWGGVLQGLYVDSFKDSIEVDGQEVDVKLDKSWEVELALPIHARFNNGLVYLGPLLYAATTDVVAEGSDIEGDIDEDGNLGAVGGVALRFDNLSIEIEAKYRSDLSAGAFVSFTF
jgi:hypothetical protein